MDRDSSTDKGVRKLRSPFFVSSWFLIPKIVINFEKFDHPFFLLFSLLLSSFISFRFLYFLFVCFCFFSLKPYLIISSLFSLFFRSFHFLQYMSLLAFYAFQVFQLCYLTKLFPYFQVSTELEMKTSFTKKENILGYICAIFILLFNQPMTCLQVVKSITSYSFKKKTLQLQVANIPSYDVIGLCDADYLVIICILPWNLSILPSLTNLVQVMSYDILMLCHDISNNFL